MVMHYNKDSYGKHIVQLGWRLGLVGQEDKGMFAVLPRGTLSCPAEVEPLILDFY